MMHHKKVESNSLPREESRFLVDGADQLCPDAGLERDA